MCTLVIRLEADAHQRSIASLQEQKELERETAPAKKNQYRGLASGKAKRDKQVEFSALDFWLLETGETTFLIFCPRHC